ncbi:MAG: DUF3500 domain-containing protein [Acidobacteria bacterium]|nr:DUF3500 domain-containing protein [Acidobacteriota bacterium]
MRPLFYSCLVALLLAGVANRSRVFGAESSTDGGATSIVLRFLEAFTPENRKKIVFDFDDAERKDWSNLPTRGYPRKGIPLAEMDDRARKLAHELMRASLSSQGYLKAAAVVHRDEVLLRTGGSSANFGAGKYYFGVFGNPGADKRWGWQFDGHHLALNFTIVDGVMTGAPALWGAQPDQIEAGDEAGWRVLAAERDKGYALVNSLTKEQRATAILSEKLPPGLFSGPQRDKALQKPEGLPASAMTAAQHALLWSLIDEYVNNQTEKVARAHHLKIEREGIAKVHFAWMGSTDPARSAYFRVHGPSILIEYDNTNPRSGTREERDSNHIHSMFRDPSNDYGEDLLKKHYQTVPHGK